MTIALSPRWRDLVFHVLAHVRGTSHLPASLFDARYVAFAERWLGRASARALGEDAVLLGRTFATHEALARAQGLAWLFDSVDQASAVSRAELAELAPADVASPLALALLDTKHPGTEVLRAAAELEAEHHAKLPPASFDGHALEGALRVLEPVAPWLERVTVSVCRALRLRGRASDGEILVGAPGPELELGVDHVAWQAAHEATVLEVSAHPGLDERTREAIALVVLAERAEAKGLDSAHGAWLGHFATRPNTSRGLLSRDAARIVELIVRSVGG